MRYASQRYLNVEQCFHPEKGISGHRMGVGVGWTKQCGEIWGRVQSSAGLLSYIPKVTSVSAQDVAGCLQRF